MNPLDGIKCWLLAVFNKDWWLSHEVMRLVCNNCGKCLKKQSVTNMKTQLIGESSLSTKIKFPIFVILLIP